MPDEVKLNPDGSQVKPGQTPTESEELVKIRTRMSEMESQLVQQIDRGNRAEALLQAYATTAPMPTNTGRAPASEDVNYFGNGIDPNQLLTTPEKVLGGVIKTAVAEATKVMEKRYMEAERMKDQSNHIRSSFYKENADLVGFEKIVGLAEDEARIQYANTPYNQLLPIIAKKAREEVLAMQKRFQAPGKDQPLPLENGGNGGRSESTSTNQEEKPLSEKEEFDQYLKERTLSRDRSTVKVPAKS